MAAHGKMEEVLGDSACPLLESHHFGNEPTMISMTVAEPVNDMIANFVARVEAIDLKPRAACRSKYNAAWKVRSACLHGALSVSFHSPASTADALLAAVRNRIEV